LNGTWFDVALEKSDPIEEVQIVKLFGKDPTEVAKYYGMFLKHKGVLRCYADESTPCKIVLNLLGGKACFNTWYTYGVINSSYKGTKIVVECCFVRKVKYVVLSYL
jgi:hypothetical protein